MMTKIFDTIDTLEWDEVPDFRQLDCFVDKLATVGNNSKLTAAEPWITIHGILFSD
jgi:hypothetical protein